MSNLFKPFLVLLATSCMLFLYACEETTFNEGPFISKRKQLTAFAFNEISLPTQAIINQENNTITARLPFDTDLTKITPTIKVSDKATVTPPSGVANDFSDTTTYIVTAENGTTETYSVIISLSEPGAQSKLILSQPIWNLSQSGVGVPSYFTADGERGVAYGNNHVYVTNNNDKILILNAETGNQEGSLNTTGLDGGAPKIADVDVSDDGSILSCNSVEFTSDAGGEATTFKVYKWSDEAADPVEFITYTNTEYRMGDSFSVIGDISTNAVILTTFGRKFLNPTTRGNLIFRWDVVDGVPDVMPTIITVQGVASLTKFGSRPHAQLLDVEDTVYYVNANDIDFTRVGLDGSFQERIPNSGRNLYDGFNSYFEIFEFADKKVIVTAFPRSASESRLLVIDITNGLEKVTNNEILLSQDFVTGSEIANVNASGAVAVNIVSSNLVEIYCLITNQALVKFELTTELEE